LRKLRFEVAIAQQCLTEFINGDQVDIAVEPNGDELVFLVDVILGGHATSVCFRSFTMVDEVTRA
jgi:hypothetical protein